MLYQLRDVKLGIVFTSEENATITKKIQDRSHHVPSNEKPRIRVYEKEMLEGKFKYLPDGLCNALEGFSEGPSSPS